MCKEEASNSSHICRRKSLEKLLKKKNKQKEPATTVAACVEKNLEMEKTVGSGWEHSTREKVHENHLHVRSE